MHGLASGAKKAAGWMALGLLLTGGSTQPVSAADSEASRWGLGMSVTPLYRWHSGWERGTATRLTVSYRLERTLLQREGWRSETTWELSGGYHRTLHGRGPNEYDLAATLVVAGSRAGSPWYLEAGTGPALFTSATVYGKPIGGRLHMGTLFGIGYRLGQDGRTQIGYRYHHFSNAGVRRPNPGLNAGGLRIHHRF